LQMTFWVAQPKNALVTPLPQYGNNCKAIIERASAKICAVFYKCNFTSAIL
jgi:hypothetical protein